MVSKMNPAVEPNDDSSDPRAGMPGLSNPIVAMLDHLDRLDNLLAKPAQDEWCQPHKLYLFPISEAEFDVVIAAKNRYRAANYKAEEVRAYLLRLPEFDDIWGGICRAILRVFRHNPNRLGE